MHRSTGAVPLFSLPSRTVHSDFDGWQELHADGGCGTPSAPPLARIDDGGILLAKGLLHAVGLQEELLERVLNLARATLTPSQFQRLDRKGFESIHTVLTAAELEKFYLDVREDLAARFPGFVRRMLRHALPLPERFFINANTVVRFMVPHEALHRGYAHFRKHLGKLDLHGPHHDYWQGVATNAINIWMALGRVRPGNGLALYPHLWGKTLPRGVSHVRDDQYLGTPLVVSCEPGDVVFFHSHHMHGSILNHTDETRFVITGRFTVDEPRHPHRDPARQLDYFDSERVGETTGAEALIPKTPLAADASFPITSVTRAVREVHAQHELAALAEGEIAAYGPRHVAVRHAGRTHVLSRFCPHQGADLSLGRLTPDGALVCPWHVHPFDIRTGVGACAMLRLDCGVSSQPTVDDTARAEVPRPEENDALPKS
jgi:nitrite reductase/ring-hydroxylating ferredoxin subunit